MFCGSGYVGYSFHTPGPGTRRGSGYNSSVFPKEGNSPIIVLAKHSINIQDFRFTIRMIYY